MQPKESIKTLLLATLFVASSWSADAAEIELQDDVVVSGAVVRLGDIARVLNEKPELAAELESLPLFPSPAAGKTRLVRKQELSQLLAFADEQLSSCRVVGASAVQIRAAQATASPATVVKVATSATVAVKPVIAKVNHEVAAPNAPKIHMASPIAVAGNTPIATTETIAVVALRKLDRGQKIRREDVELQQVSSETLESGAIYDLNAVVGREATQSINAKVAISAKMVQSPRLVRRGETVTVRSVAAGVRITTSAKALEDGSDGSLVQIDLEESHERITARVTGMQQVEVYANGPRIAKDSIPLATQPNSTQR
jgi:flagella basal body P-ring formation protein FlgA